MEAVYLSSWTLYCGGQQVTGDFGPRHGQERPWIVPWREAKPGRYSRFAIRAAEVRGGVCGTTDSRRERKRHAACSGGSETERRLCRRRADCQQPRAEPEAMFWSAWPLVAECEECAGREVGADRATPRRRRLVDVLDTHTSGQVCQQKDLAALTLSERQRLMKESPMCGPRSPTRAFSGLQYTEEQVTGKRLWHIGFTL